MPAMRPPETSSTCKAHGSCPPCRARLVLRIGGRPVRLGRDQPRAPAPDPRAEAPGGDVVVGLQPERVGRHRPRGVVSEQRRERVHVVALERVDVASEERALLGVHRTQRLGVGDLGRLDRRVGALQGAVDRRDRRLEQLGDLGGLPAEDVTQHEHRTLLRRQVLERGDEGDADRLARLGHLGGVAVDRQHAVVGDRQDPRGLGQGLTEVRRLRRLRRPEVHGAGAAFLPAQHVETHVRRDAVEPGAQRRATLERLETTPRTQHRLLHGVLGLESRAEHAVGVGGELAAMLFEPQLQVFGCANHGHHPTTGRRRRTHRSAWPTLLPWRPKRSRSRSPTRSHR